MEASDKRAARVVRDCPKGTILFKEGDPGTTMFVLKEGRIAITKAVKGGDKTLAILGAGEFFGEMAILNARPRAATAEVIDDAKLLEIDSKTFEQMIVNNSEIAIRLIQRLAKRLESANALIELMMHRDPKARFILGLSRQAELVGVEREDGTIAIELPPEELAEELGLTVKEVDDVVRRLSRLGIVEDIGAGIVINDRARLQEFYEFLESQQARVQES